MAIIRDLRAKSYNFDRLNNIQSFGRGYYSPTITGQTYYFNRDSGVAGRCDLVLSGGESMFLTTQPKVNTNSSGEVRCEVTDVYESISLPRGIAFEFVVPETWIINPNHEAMIMQVHESVQPNGGRNPPFGMSIITTPENPNRLYLDLIVAQDAVLDGSGNSQGTSGSSTPARLTKLFQIEIAVGQKVRVALKYKAAGLADDYMQAAVNGVQLCDYIGAIGYVNGSQNYAKFGVYTYPPVAATYNYLQCLHSGLLITDATESLINISNLLNTSPKLSRHDVHLSVIGDGMALGISPAGDDYALSMRGAITCDPISPNGVGLSAWPQVVESLADKGIRASVSNHGRLKRGITGITGRVLQYQVGVQVQVGDILLPSTKQGVNGVLPDGFMFISNSAGALPAEPTWVTDTAGVYVYSTTTGGAFTFTATPRPLGLSVGVCSTSDLHFDPHFDLRNAISTAISSRADKKYLVLLAGTLDVTIGQQASVVDAVNKLKAFCAARGVTVVVVSPPNVTDSAFNTAINTVSDVSMTGQSFTIASGELTDQGQSQLADWLSINLVDYL